MYGSVINTECDVPFVPEAALSRFQQLSIKTICHFWPEANKNNQTPQSNIQKLAAIRTNLKRDSQRVA